ncbi:kynureninase [Rhizohabitans arisaemae]|uniref:kynureninase n=1 Tax=Rhizohabitans arisaemae TaxID=2720610 RepID=UPI0024B1BD5C|nr:kynureninase [Rhizohabitans arisaemae]
MSLTRARCEALDAADPLAGLRDEFVLPHGMIYLTGNSLGALPKAASARITHMVEEEWGQGLTKSWNDAGWFVLPRTMGNRIAPLIGAGQGEVVVADTTSVNVFKVVVAAMRMRPGRKTVVIDRTNFPTDNYMVEGAVAAFGTYKLRDLSEYGSADSAAGFAFDDDVAVVLVSEVDYRTGRRYDMDALTERAHASGALIVWDLCHSAGVVPIDLNGCDADFAVGCTYKYLNGGPGSPAFIFAATRHHDAVDQPLPGWYSHAEPFAMEPGYRPTGGIVRFLTSTPHVISYGGLAASLDIFDKVDLAEVRAKSVALTSLFIDLVEERCAQYGLSLASPRAPSDRGSQVSFRHENAYAITRALSARGVQGDFRAPDIARFGLAPLYLRHVDVYDAAEILGDIMSTGTWQSPEYQARLTVT